jgi:hypothetical protein
MHETAHVNTHAGYFTSADRRNAGIARKSATLTFFLKIG